MKNIIKNSIIIFILCFIFHFLYDFIKLPILRIFVPTNESIFAHLKMLFTSAIIFSLFTKDINKYLKGLLRGVLSISILLIFYIPIYLNFGEILPITLVILFFSILISEIIVSKIKKYSKKLNYLSIFIIIFIYYMFLYLTDKPFNNFFFNNPSK